MPPQKKGMATPDTGRDGYNIVMQSGSRIPLFKLLLILAACAGSYFLYADSGMSPSRRFLSAFALAAAASLFIVWFRRSYLAGVILVVGFTLVGALVGLAAAPASQTTAGSPASWEIALDFMAIFAAAAGILGMMVSATSRRVNDVAGSLFVVVFMIVGSFVGLAAGPVVTNGFPSGWIASPFAALFAAAGGILGLVLAAENHRAIAKPVIDATIMPPKR